MPGSLLELESPAAREVLADLEASIRQELSASGSPVGRELREMIAYHLDTGGKRLRPFAVALTVAAYRAAKKESWDWAEESTRILPMATAIEFLHNATLIHDDLQDGDTVRRGQPTLWKKFSAPQAINCGDYLFFAALRLTRSEAYRSEERARLSELLSDSALLVIEGQGAEFALKECLERDQDLPGIEAYREMAEGKTAALFSLPLLSGAVIAGASLEEQEKLAGLGARLGFLFQLCDDWIDLWGQKGRSSPASDIAEGKLSYPVVRALGVWRENAPEKSKRLREILLKDRAETSAADIAWVLEAFASLGWKESLRNEIQAELKALEKDAAEGPFAQAIETLAKSFSQSLAI